MIWLIIAAVVIVWCVRKLLQPDPPKIRNIYSQPGKWYWLKKIIFTVVLKLRKRKQANQSLENTATGGADCGYGKGGGNIELLESVQNLNDGKFSIDTAYFASFGTDGTNLVMRIARRPDRCAEVWLFLDLPGIGTFQHPVHPDVHVANTDSNSFSCSGLSFEMLEPMKQWKISYNGLLRVGLHNGISEKPEKYVSVQMHFMWRAFSDHFNFDTDMSSSLIADGVAKEPWTKEFYDCLKNKHQSHYEQWGELRGKIQVEGYDERHVCLKSLRDHTFGVRDWREFHRYALHFFWLESGLVAQVGVVCQPNIFTNLKIGYVSFANGDLVPVTDMNLNLWEIGEDSEPPNKYSFSFWADGQKYDIEVSGGITPVWYHHEDRGSKVLERFCTFSVNGIPGRGLTEYCYRNFDGPIFVPEISLPHLCEPNIAELSEEDRRKTTVYFTDTACSSSHIVGGKGSQLALLTQVQSKLDAIVPTGFCLTLKAFNTQVQNFPEIQKKIESLSVAVRIAPAHDLQVICFDIVDMFKSAPVHEGLLTDIRNGLSALFGGREESTHVAVRSSAAGEDGTEASSAGQMETFLGVKGFNQIVDAVRKCWASAYTYQAVEYRRQHGQPMKTSVGVIIQEMVKSDVAGVLFTSDPVSGDSSLISINANYGLGESVVSGKSDPDTITVKREWKDRLVISNKFIGGKKSVMTVKENGGVEEDLVTMETGQCSLSDEAILKLGYIAVELEKYFGNCRDIEWAVKDGRIFLLQCRPITTAHQETEDELLHEFDSAFSFDRDCVTTGNIGEMMPGALTPLSLSIFAPSLNYGLQEYTYDMGAKRRICQSAMVAIKSCCNHLFISISCLESSTLSVGSTKTEMLELALLGEVLNLISEEDSIRYCGKKEGALLRTINFFRMIRKIHNASGQTAEWERRLLTYCVGVDCEDSASLYREITNKLPDYIDVWSCTMTNSARSSSWSNVLMGILTEGGTEWTSEHYGDLALMLSQCEDVYSAEVPTLIQNLAKQIADAGLRDKFLTLTEKECLSVIESGKYKDLQKSLETFLSRHGHRCIREAEFMEKSWKMQPEGLMKVILSILRTKSFERPPKSFSSTQEIIDQLKSKLPSFQKWILKVLLPRVRRSVGSREWGKSISIEMSDKFKQAYWKLSQLLLNEGRIPDRELMFFMTHTEIGKLIKTRSARLIMLASRRRKILQKQMALKFTKTVCGHPQLVEETGNLEVSVDYIWTGMPVSHGTANGTARVVLNLEHADEIQPGDILVVRCTDVGWTPYFPLISGLVTEVGGLISHGAVVAREYGIPCIVNVSNATSQIKSGEQVKIDGKSGTVMKVKT